MKYLLLILSMSILLSAELEVDGNLKVTGTIQNDSLAQVIANLQAQITALQAQLAQLDCINNGIIPQGYCDCDGNVLDVCGDCGGDTQDSEECVCIDIDGNSYDTILIGDQLWMAENLRTTSDNQNNAIGYYCYDDTIDNCDDYGRLYTWETLNNNEICPIGWHVPSDSAFTTLERYICSDIVGDDDCEYKFPYVQEYNVWRGSNEAGAIKDGEIEFPPGWIYYAEVESDNQTGFSALPGGIYFTGGYFANKGQSAYLWASSLSEDGLPYFRTLTYDSQQIRRDATNSEYAMSVRCIKD